jgi:Protein of unknown function (DUF3631)
VLLDEVDGVFGKRASDVAEDHRKLLNSGYRKGKQAIRCGGRNNTELQYFNVFCPKALAGLNELPGTLAHRAIPIAMQPPRPDDSYEDFDPEEVEEEAAMLREHLQEWAARAESDLLDPALKPAKLPELDARRNEIWRILFRVADLAGGRWPDAARDAAGQLSGGDRRADEASAGIKLLGHVRGVFEDERMSCAALVEALNDDEGCHTAVGTTPGASRPASWATSWRGTASVRRVSGCPTGRHPRATSAASSRTRGAATCLIWTSKPPQPPQAPIQAKNRPIQNRHKTEMWRFLKAPQTRMNKAMWRLWRFSGRNQATGRRSRQASRPTSGTACSRRSVSF